ncbi:ABC transporter substrate-binding protein [Streptomyces sp. NBC_00467]|uniref:ABC transporter substrate-binding protein n=1 Tax=Streptomyces sp. NBC_00467 TaxID=2975752 RepID=UPI002E173087
MLVSHRRRMSALAYAATATGLLMAGCSSPQQAPSTGTSISGRGPITLATGKDSSGTLVRLVSQWNAQHPKERVRVVQMSDSPDEQRQRMIQDARLKSGEFSVLSLDVVWTAEFAANRWITPLPKARTEQFLKPTVEGASYRGELFAMPWTSDAGLLFYRKDLLAKVGVRPPQTWQQMKKACNEILARTTGTSCYAGQFDKYEGLTVNFAEAVDSAGGAVTDAEGQPTVNTPEAERGLRFLTDAFADGLIPKKAITFKEEEGRQEFQKGRLVFHRQWPYQWSLASAKDGSSKVAGKFGVVPLPGADGPGKSSLGGHNLAVSTGAKNKATALDFITFLTSRQTQRTNLLLSSNAPTDASLYDDGDLVKKYPYLPVLKEAILAASPRPRVVRYGDATAAIQDAAYRALSGQSTPREALKELQSRLAALPAS